MAEAAILHMKDMKHKGRKIPAAAAYKDSRPLLAEKTGIGGIIAGDSLSKEYFKGLQQDPGRGRP